MDSTYSVYKHTFPNGKVYIGITSQKPEKRWDNGYGYLGKTRNGEYRQPSMAKAILKYGWSNIQHEIIYNGLNKEDAEKTEIALISKFKSNKKAFGYNIASGGNATQKLPEETKRKISMALSGYRHPLYGKHHSDSTKKKISEAKKGEKNPLYGKPLSDEAKRKKSEAVRGNKNPFYGKTHSEEAKKKISNATAGKNNPNYGKRHTEDVKNKISEVNSKQVLCVETGIVYKSQSYASKQTRALQQHISNVCNGKAKTAGGYQWKYIHDQIHKDGTIIPGAITLGLVAEEMFGKPKEN